MLHQTSIETWNSDTLTTVMALAIIFMLVITGYRFFVRSQNRKLESGPAGQAVAMKNGVTQEMVDMGWRYECY